METQNQKQNPEEKGEIWKDAIKLLGEIMFDVENYKSHKLNSEKPEKEVSK